MTVQSAPYLITRQQETLAGFADDTPVTLVVCTTRLRLMMLLARLDSSRGAIPIPSPENPSLDGDFDQIDAYIDILNALGFVENPSEATCADEIAVDETPFYEDEDDIRGERDGQATYEFIGEVVIDGFLALVGVDSAIVYRAISPIVELVFKDTPSGIVGRVLVNDIERQLIELTGTGGFRTFILDFGEFVTGEYDLRIENIMMGSGGFVAQSAHNYLPVVRKKLPPDEGLQTMFRLGQNDLNPFLLEQSFDAGETYEPAFDYSILNRRQSLIDIENINVEITNFGDVYEGDTGEFFDDIDPTNELSPAALCFALRFVTRAVLQSMIAAGRTVTADNETDWSRGVANFTSTVAGVLGGLAQAAQAVGVRTWWITPKISVALIGFGVIVQAGLALTEPDPVTGENTRELDAIEAFINDPEFETYLCALNSAIRYPLTRVELGAAYLEAATAIDYTDQDTVTAVSIAFGILADDEAFLFQLLEAWNVFSRATDTPDVLLAECPCPTPDVFRRLNGFGSAGMYPVADDLNAGQYVASEDIWINDVYGNVSLQASAVYVVVRLPELAPGEQWRYFYLRIRGGSRFNDSDVLLMRFRQIGESFNSTGQVVVEPPASATRIEYDASIGNFDGTGNLPSLKQQTAQEVALYALDIIGGGVETIDVALLEFVAVKA